jgi:hypothetical protein
MTLWRSVARSKESPVLSDPGIHWFPGKTCRNRASAIELTAILGPKKFLSCLEGTLP